MGLPERLPTFDELPIKPGSPPHSAWGVFGDDDGIGCLNFLTPAGIVEAANLVQSGKVFRLDARIGFAQPTLFGRATMARTVVPLGPMANDDVLNSYNTQEGTQWDGLGHVGPNKYQRFYNGVTVEEIRERGNPKLGIHRWADRVVGRGVLIDAYAFLKSRGTPANALERHVYTLEDLQGALEWQKTKLKPGTILLVRTGWMEEYEKLPADGKQAIAPFDKIRAAGVEATRRLAAWLWDNRVAAIGTDCPGVEALPMELGDDGLLHYRALPLLGLPLGELFVLAPLAEDCAADGRYEFMMVSTPLNLEGGIASPPNAVAIK